MTTNHGNIDDTGPMAPAVCYIDGEKHPVTLTNASQAGCCAVICACRASPGDKVILRLTPVLAVPAKVGWVEATHIGLKFSSQVHGAMVEQFVTLHHVSPRG